MTQLPREARLRSETKQTLEGEDTIYGGTKYPHSFVELLTSFRCRSPMFPNDFGVVLRLTDEATIADAFKVFNLTMNCIKKLGTYRTPDDVHPGCRLYHRKTYLCSKYGSRR